MVVLTTTGPLRPVTQVNTYNFYTSSDGRPLKLHMFGYNNIAIGHYDGGCGSGIMRLQ